MGLSNFFYFKGLPVKVSIKLCMKFYVTEDFLILATDEMPLQCCQSCLPEHVSLFDEGKTA